MNTSTQKKPKNQQTKTGKILAIVYFAALFYVTIFSRVLGTYPFTLVAGTNWQLFHWFREGSYDDIVYGTNWMTDFFGNIILFMPYVPAIKQLLRFRNPPFLVLQAFVLSCCIEYIQYKFSIGSAAIDDVMLNTFGAWLGYKLWPYFMRYYNQLEK